jgi:hypothetical protein
MPTLGKRKARELQLRHRCSTCDVASFPLPSISSFQLRAPSLIANVSRRPLSLLTTTYPFKDLFFIHGRFEHQPKSQHARSLGRFCRCDVQFIVSELNAQCVMHNDHHRMGLVQTGYGRLVL